MKMLAAVRVVEAATGQEMRVKQRDKKAMQDGSGLQALRNADTTQNGEPEKHQQLQQQPKPKLQPKLQLNLQQELKPKSSPTPVRQ